MIRPRTFLCSGATLPDKKAGDPSTQVVSLNSLGSDPNVNIRISDVARVFGQHLSPRMVDLLEIAAYVYTADCGVERGNGWEPDASEEHWQRDLHLVIPVRDYDFWCQTVVCNHLQRILMFLSDDTYRFTFVPFDHNHPTQDYLELGDFDLWPFRGVERVVLFSGGLDSLVGAVETLVSGKRVVLVTHRSISIMNKRVRELVAELKQRYVGQVLHVPVWVNKEDGFDREHSQRTRSFLFAALGTAVAISVPAEGVRFFENGVVSLNLPVADEVRGARASRTTHPQVLRMFCDFFTLLADRHVLFDNPYLFLTKAEVVAKIGEAGASDLIAMSSSCAHHGHSASRTQWHCGTCSQCIDRRVAILAAGYEDHDPVTDYVSDVFTGPRKDGYERNIAIGYVRHALELATIDEVEIARRFNLELSRASRWFERPSKAAEKFVHLHQRHGTTVAQVVTQAFERNARRFVHGDLDPTSLLAVVAGQEHRNPAWRRYADEIALALNRGLPVACKSHKPKNETHLQEICDAILKGHDLKLRREYPFMRWSSTLTKPDWSIETLNLVVEAKYIRQKSDIGPITEALAADVTKYGDNGRYVLYVVYDHLHLIDDDEEFSAPMIARETMVVRFIR